MSPKRVLLVAAATAAFGAPALSQDSPEQQARRLLEDGRAYWAKGQYKQALDNFNTIVTVFPNAGSVVDALLELGRYHLEIEGDPGKAREAFEQVTKRYPQSDGAPGAYYYLGLLTMNRAASPAELDDALAQFVRVQRLYPRSEWVPKALYASGLVHRTAGRLADAVDSERRVSLEYPTSEAAPLAQFQIGHCLALLGEPRQAMEEFQQVRNRYPESESAARALERITAIYRLYGFAKPTFVADPSYSAGAGDILKDVRAILMTPSRTLWLASEKTKSAVPIDSAGKIGASVPAEDVRSLCLTPRGQVLVVAKLAIRIGPKEVKNFTMPSEKPGTTDPLDRLVAAVMTPGGDFIVADEKKKRVFRFDTHGKYAGPFPDAKEREVTRMTVDEEGGIVLLDRGDKTVRVFDESGRMLRFVGPKGQGFEFKHPADVAVDPLRNLYVADEEAGVLIFSPQGRLLGTIGAEELKRPRSLTLDTNGAVLVYDDKVEKVLRYK